MSISVEFLRDLRFPHDSPAFYEVGMSDAQAARVELRLRQKYLSTSVRIVPELFPRLADVVESVRLKLCFDKPIDSYVFNSAEHQAFSVGAAENVRPIIGVSSSLVQILNDDEMRFVFGHEIGHYIMGHGKYPCDEEIQDDKISLNRLALKRAAEISADRIAFISCQHRDSAFKAMLKTASGLPDQFIRFDVARFLDQERDIRLSGGAEFERRATHPMFSARVRALLWFEMSDSFCNIQSRGSACFSLSDVNIRIENDLAAVSGFNIGDANQELILEATLWGIMSLFISDQCLNKTEQQVLEARFGSICAKEAIAHAQSGGAVLVEKKREEAFSKIRNLPLAYREDLLRQLAHFSSDAGSCNEGTNLLLLRYASQIGVKK